MARKLVCVCNFISEKEILKAIDEGASDLEDIKILTGAGTSCGRCHPAVILLLKERTTAKPSGSQGRLF
jgi:bacterioferritin-associated ferredoxin